MKPELQKLFEGVNGLSTDFLDKVQGLVESKVIAARLQAIQETEDAGNKERLALVEAHNAEIQALRESHLEEVAATLDSFLNAVVEEWANTNAPAIDSKIKVEAAENLLSGMVGVLKESRINFVADENGVVEQLNKRLAETEANLAKSQSELSTLREADTARARDEIVNRICEGMVDTKKEVVINLLEGIALDDEKLYESRVRTFRNLVEGSKDGDFKDNLGKDDEKKKLKSEGDDGDEDDDKKSGKDKKSDDPDETNKEVNESVKNQIEAWKARKGLNG